MKKEIWERFKSQSFSEDYVNTDAYEKLIGMRKQMTTWGIKVETQRKIFDMLYEDGLFD